MRPATTPSVRPHSNEFKAAVHRDGAADNKRRRTDSGCSWQSEKVGQARPPTQIYLPPDLALT